MSKKLLFDKKIENKFIIEPDEIINHSYYKTFRYFSKLSMIVADKIYTSQIDKFTEDVFKDEIDIYFNKSKIDKLNKIFIEPIIFMNSKIDLKFSKFEDVFKDYDTAKKIVFPDGIIEKDEYFYYKQGNNIFMKLNVSKSIIDNVLSKTNYSYTILISENGRYDFLLVNTTKPFYKLDLIGKLAIDCNKNFLTNYGNIISKKCLNFNQFALDNEMIDGLISYFDINFSNANEFVFDNDKKILSFYNNDRFKTFKVFYEKNNINDYKIELVSNITYSNDINDENSLKQLSDELSQLKDKSSDDGNQNDKNIIRFTMTTLLEKLILSYVTGEVPYDFLERYIYYSVDYFIELREKYKLADKFIIYYSNAEVHFSLKDMDVKINPIGNTNVKAKSLVKKYSNMEVKEYVISDKINDLGEFCLDDLRFWITYSPVSEINIDIDEKVDLLNKDDIDFLYKLDKLGFLTTKIKTKCSLNVNNVSHSFYENFEFVKKHLPKSLAKVSYSFYELVDKDTFYFQKGDIIPEAIPFIKDKFSREIKEKYATLAEMIKPFERIINTRFIKKNDLMSLFWSRSSEIEKGIFNVSFLFGCVDYIIDVPFGTKESDFLNIYLGVDGCDVCNDEYKNKFNEVDCYYEACDYCNSVDEESEKKVDRCISKYLTPVSNSSRIKNGAEYSLFIDSLTIDINSKKYYMDIRFNKYYIKDIGKHKKGDVVSIFNGSTSDISILDEVFFKIDIITLYNDSYIYTQGIIDNYAKIKPTNNKTNAKYIEFSIECTEEDEDYFTLKIKPENYQGHIIIDDMLVIKE